VTAKGKNVASLGRLNKKSLGLGTKVLCPFGPDRVVSMHAISCNAGESFLPSYTLEIDRNGEEQR